MKLTYKGLLNNRHRFENELSAGKPGDLEQINESIKEIAGWCKPLGSNNWFMIVNRIDESQIYYHVDELVDDVIDQRIYVRVDVTKKEDADEFEKSWGYEA